MRLDAENSVIKDGKQNGGYYSVLGLYIGIMEEKMEEL